MKETQRNNRGYLAFFVLINLCDRFNSLIQMNYVSANAWQIQCGLMTFTEVRPMLDARLFRSNFHSL